MAQPIWNTALGSLGSCPALLPISIQLSATAVAPATSVTYILLSGSLPSGLTITSSGLIAGTPAAVVQEVISNFTVRATDNLGNIRDRTFSILVSGSAVPQFTTIEGNLLSVRDSTWIEFDVEYSNPISSNEVVIEIKEGSLPPGLEIDTSGTIRGYALPPTINISYAAANTTSTISSSSTNEFTCLSTNLFSEGRPLVFTGSAFGGIETNVTYYVKNITSSTTFTISATQDGPLLLLSNGSGLMSINLPAISLGQPIIKTYSFTLKLFSPLGSDTGNYNITVINQNTPVSQGGPGLTPNTRIPSILNTRPLTFDLTNADIYFGYYILPPVNPSVSAQIGTIQSGDIFSFKAIGYDFDGNQLSYSFSGLPLGMVGDPNTGWVTGTPVLADIGISNYTFNVRAFKTTNPAISTPNFNFGITVAKEVIGNIVWITPSDLGTLFNGQLSTLSVRAESDVEISYELLDGTLPPNLTLSSNGEILGIVADQPSSTYLELGDDTQFTFTVQATSVEYPMLTSQRTFTLMISQEFTEPTDILYIKATPDIDDRRILRTLLDDPELIPNAYLYRPDDSNFGKASSVIYQHAYGIYASNIATYLAAVTRNHYYRALTLGEIKTAVAKNINGEIIYEVVYSEIIDNLVNPEGVSVSNPINWPRSIDLSLGPWYTSVTDTYTSYSSILGQDYYSSLTYGTATTLYANSLTNMRNRVAQITGQEFNTKLLPLWMTSQQANGGTLGFVPAWVICYTKPGYSEIIKNNINTDWGYLAKPGVPESFIKYSLNQINFEIDRFSVNKSSTFNFDDNLDPHAWTSLPSGQPKPNPADSKDFYVLFPRTTILPNESE
jgi:hypothetical protein